MHQRSAISSTAFTHHIPKSLKYTISSKYYYLTSAEVAVFSSHWIASSWKEIRPRFSLVTGHKSTM